MNELKIGNGISKRFLMGSMYFFEDYEDYSAKDMDYVYFVDEPLIFKTVMTIRGTGRVIPKEDVFYWKKMTPDEFVEHHLNSGMPMQCGKFLIPEINEYLGFTIEHLKKLSPVFEKIDDTHKYETAIFKYYVENGEFKLTKEQLDNVYEIYKQCK